MTAAHPPTWPNSRVLAGWWPTLERFQPRSLWLCHLLLHRVEAPVAVARPGPPSQLEHLLLEAVADGAAEHELARRLHLDAQLLRRLLTELESACLAHPDAAGAWSLSGEGKQALAGERPPQTQHERRTFWFAEGPPSHPGTRFLPLDPPPTTPLPNATDWHFDAETLRACVRQPAAWKQAHGFPEDVRTVACVSGKAAGEDWRRVTLDRPEQ